MCPEVISCFLVIPGVSIVSICPNTARDEQLYEFSEFRLSLDLREGREQSVSFVPVGIWGQR